MYCPIIQLSVAHIHGYDMIQRQMYFVYLDIFSETLKDGLLAILYPVPKCVKLHLCPLFLSRFPKPLETQVPRNIIVV